MQEKFDSHSHLKQGLLFSLCSAAAYGINPIFAKLGYFSGLSDIEILHARFFFAVMVLLIIGPCLEPKFFRFPSQLIKSSCWLSFLILLPLNLLYVYALKDVPASLMSLITYLYPLVILCINCLFCGFPFEKSQICSVSLIICSCFCIFSDAFNQHISALGLCLAIAATFFYAIYLIGIQQVISKSSALQLTFLTLLLSTLGLSLFHNPISLIHYSREQLTLSFFYGFISTVLSTLFVTKAIKYLGATEASIFCSSEPAFTICFACLLLNEQVPIIRVLGMFLLIFSIILPNIQKLKSAFSCKLVKIIQYKE